ncbi:MAG: hypothetical protein V1747_04030 [Candidatus Omnitrophota bacterium]
MKYLGLAGTAAMIGGCIPVYDLSQRTGPFFTKPLEDTRTIGTIRQRPRWEDTPYFYYKIELEPIDKNNLKLSDFVFKKDELEGKGLRLSRDWEKVFTKSEELNPLITNEVDRYPFKNDSFSELNPGKLLVADYIEQTNYPYHRLGIIAKEYDKKEVWEKTRVRYMDVFEKASKNSKTKVYGKFPFIVNLISINTYNMEKAFLDKNHEQEHIERAEIYAEKRGLEFVAGNY